MQQDERTDWQPVDLGDGAKAYLQVIPRGGREEVGVLEAIPFEQVVATLGRIAKGIEKAQPSKAVVEIGVEFGLEAGELVALIARGTGKANLKVMLEWKKS